MIEHRSAKSPDPLLLDLRSDDTPPHLTVLGTAKEAAPDASGLKADVLTELSRGEPITQQALRAKLRVRLQRLVEAMRELEADGQVVRTSAGWTVGIGAGVPSGAEVEFSGKGSAGQCSQRRKVAQQRD